MQRRNSHEPALIKVNNHVGSLWVEADVVRRGHPVLLATARMDDERPEGSRIEQLPDFSYHDAYRTLSGDWSQIQIRRCRFESVLSHRTSTATKNHPIITIPIATFPTIPATVPRKVPHVERPAGSSPLPPSSSPRRTPANGPRSRPTGP
jgi:hypothetical protein